MTRRNLKRWARENFKPVPGGCAVACAKTRLPPLMVKSGAMRLPAWAVQRTGRKVTPRHLGRGGCNFYARPGRPAGAWGRSTILLAPAIQANDGKCIERKGA